MPSHDIFPILRARGLVPALLLGAALGVLTGCPVKMTCSNCHVNDVFADGSRPNPSPSSTLNVQLSSSGSTVREVRVELLSADGSSETLTYSGDQVARINSTSITRIPDPELYDVEGKAPIRGTIELVFTNGKSITNSLEIQAESTGPTAPGTPPI